MCTFDGIEFSSRALPYNPNAIKMLLHPQDLPARQVGLRD